jgi:hypothetical protein
MTLGTSWSLPGPTVPPRIHLRPRSVPFFMALASQLILVGCPPLRSLPTQQAGPFSNVEDPLQRMAWAQTLMSASRNHGCNGANWTTMTSPAFSWGAWQQTKTSSTLIRHPESSCPATMQSLMRHGTYRSVAPLRHNSYTTLASSRNGTLS